jgi:hypothetical protein
MNRLSKLSLVLSVLLGVSAMVVGGTSKPQPAIMGVSLGMSRTDARARLQAIGSLDRETRKRQEVWTIREGAVSHLLVGYDAELRVRYVTAIARTGGPRIRYQDVADLKSAQREQNQGNYKVTWQIAARSGHSAYLLIAHGHDPDYLDSYSVKKLAEKEEEVD